MIKEMKIFGHELRFGVVSSIPSDQQYGILLRYDIGCGWELSICFYKWIAFIEWE